MNLVITTFLTRHARWLLDVVGATLRPFGAGLHAEVREIGPKNGWRCFEPTGRFYIAKFRDPFATEDCEC